MYDVLLWHQHTGIAICSGSDHDHTNGWSRRIEYEGRGDMQKEEGTGGGRRRGINQDEEKSEG
jgi:hypothetical protein